MKKPVLFLSLLMFFVVPAALRAAEYRSDICQFSLPEGFEIVHSDDGSLFAATNGQDFLSFFHLPIEHKIDKEECLKIPDAQWFSALRPYQIVETGKPWFTRHDKFTVFRKPDGSFVKVYRYVSTHQIGFLIAKNATGDWTAADQAAAACRGFRTLWEQVLRVWYLFFGAILIVCVCFYLRERLTSSQFWRKAGLWTLAAGALYAVGFYLLPQYMNYFYLAIGLGYLLILIADGEDSSGSDDGGSSPGYDGTGHTFNANI